MDYAGLVDQVAGQAKAMRAAALAAGPDAPVPTCPQWTVRHLVQHIAKVYQWSTRAVLTEPDGPRPTSQDSPRDWAELLDVWDERAGELVTTLRGRDPDTPAWMFLPGAPRTTGFWARRQAHETAIHRLDAEHAAAGGDTVPTLVFEPDLAADGIDEALRYVVAARLLSRRPEVAGTVLFHAADAGRTWLAVLHTDGPLRVSPAEPGMSADASVVGTADAVYRAVWHRPSTAVLGGDSGLLGALSTP